MVDPRHHMEDLRHAGGMSAAGMSAAAAAGYGVDAKTSSAFSPIQGGMLNSSSGFGMASSRNYLDYNPLTFPKHHSQVRMSNETSSPPILSQTN